MSSRLSEVPLHQPAVVKAIGGARPFRRRLMEMGLVPGTRIEVINVAPLGDPLELRVRGGSLSIRRAEADAITVRPAAARAVGGGRRAARPGAAPGLA